MAGSARGKFDANIRKYDIDIRTCSIEEALTLLARSSQVTTVISQSPVGQTRTRRTEPSCTRASNSSRGQ
jgi:hypothetical protein